MNLVPPFLWSVCLFLSEQYDKVKAVFPDTTMFYGATVCKESSRLEGNTKVRREKRRAFRRLCLIPKQAVGPYDNLARFSIQLTSQVLRYRDDC